MARPDEVGILSKSGDGALVGVERAGEKALRKSVYAVGGVIGVFANASSSCLMTSSRSPGCGLWGICEGNVADLGNVADFGVIKAGRTGLGDFGDVSDRDPRGFTVGFWTAAAMLSTGVVLRRVM